MRSKSTTLGVAGMALACLCACRAAGAQCTDPVPPRAGFGYKFERDKVVAFSDLYRTYATVVYPDAAPGPCGWPLLVSVPGLGESHQNLTGDRVELAQRGFFLVTYDVRGQGAARALNPGRGSQLWALDEWIDLAEIIEWAAAAHPGKVDASRVGVFGDSQGAVHSWAAAAYSGQPLPANPRRTRPFPRVTAVVPRFFSPSSIDVLTPQTSAFLHQLTGLAYESASSAVLLDAGYRTRLASYLDADDAAGLEAYQRLIPGKDFLAALRTTAVPTLAILAWQDGWMDPNGVFAALAAMPAQTPKRLFLTTGQHGTPHNGREEQRQILLTMSWFERFLKKGSEPVEHGPPILASLAPADQATYADAKSLWRQRAELQYPPPDVSKRIYHLRSRGRLTTELAARGEVYDLVQNTVASGYDARDFFADGGLPSRVLQSVPLSSFAYVTEPLTGELELFGFPRLSLAVEPSSKRFLIGARLVAIAPDLTERVLATGAYGARLSSAPGPMRLAFDLGAVGTVVPRGYKLRLDVRNHDLQRPLDVESFRRLPYFENSAVRVVHDGNSEQSWIELPARPRVVPDIASAAARISISAPGSQDFVLRSSPGWQGWAYVVLLGVSGQGPAAPLPGGGQLWLVGDAVTSSLLGIVNRPPLEGFVGLFDAQGQGACRLSLGGLPTVPLSLAGSYLQVCPLLVSPRFELAAGAPIRLRLE